MAEPATAAGLALAAEQVVSTTLQLGTAGYILSKPTQPLAATFTRVATFQDADMHERSLARSHHSVTVLDGKAYVFGGLTGAGKDVLASADMHVVNLRPSADGKGSSHDPEYQLVPVVTVEGKPGPRPRARHAACAFRGCVAVYGGVDGNGEELKEERSIWVFEPVSKTWDLWHEFDAAAEEVDDVGHARGVGKGDIGAAKMWPHGEEALIISQSGKSGCTFWKFDATGLEHESRGASAKGLGEGSDPSSTRKRWYTLPSLSAAAEVSNTAYHEGHLYAITSTDPLSSELHILKVPESRSTTAEGPQWTTLTFPTHPLNPGPRARYGGALLALATGFGRNYLVYLLGARSPSPDASQTSQLTQWSDTWALQIPSSALTPQPALSLASALKPAKLKDAIRDKIGVDAGTWSWAEVQVDVPEVLGGVGADEGMGEGEGKLHPGPRAWFGAEVFQETGKGEGGGEIVIWGGEEPNGERVGDGWVVRVK